jgi:hypothetical protein
MKKINFWKQTIASGKITPYYSIHLFGRTFTEYLQTPINCKEEEEKQEQSVSSHSIRNWSREKIIFLCCYSLKFQLC